MAREIQADSIEVDFEEILRRVDDNSPKTQAVITEDRTMSLLRRAGVVEASQNRTHAQNVLAENGGSVTEAARTLSYIMINADKLETRRKACMDILNIHGALPDKNVMPQIAPVQVFVQNSDHVNIAGILNPKREY